MDVKEFISTGILESYLLGTASQQEISTVHQMLAQHPYLKIEIDALEEALLQVASSKKYPLSSQLKEKIFASIHFNQTQDLSTPIKKTTPLVPLPVQQKTIPGYIRYGLVATIGLLILSGILNITLWYKNTHINNQLVQISKTQVHLETELAAQKELVDGMYAQITALANVHNKTIVLKGANSSLASVYWNDQSKKSYLFISNLPPAPAGKQYQLWAMVKGQPVNAGVFNTNGPPMLQTMKFIQTPEAFAVTLEKQGGSLTPTMSTMALFGQV